MLTLMANSKIKHWMDIATLFRNWKKYHMVLQNWDVFVHQLKFSSLITTCFFSSRNLILGLMFFYYYTLANPFSSEYILHGNRNVQGKSDPKSFNLYVLVRIWYSK